MALSNWDTLAFDTDGKSSFGEFSIDGYSVDIYKNWVNLITPKNERLNIDSGIFHVGPFNIMVARHDNQNSVFVFVQHSDWSDNKLKQRFFCGIGCYGFWGDLEYIQKFHKDEFSNLNIDPKYLTDDYDRTIESQISASKENDFTKVIFYNNTITDLDYKNSDHRFEVELPKELLPSYEQSWCGVRVETVEAFKKWLEEVAPPEYFAQIQWNDAVRYNQGDMFFAENLSEDCLQATKVGEQKGPMLLQMLLPSAGEKE